MSDYLAIENAKIITADSVFDGGLIVEDGVIQEMTPKGQSVERAIDADGDYLLPGLVELHTDNLERQFQPRPAVRWPPDAAMLAHDQQMASAGITTVFDAVAVGYHEGKKERSEFLIRSIEALERAKQTKSLKADHYLHLRCEISSPHVIDNFEPLRDQEGIRLISFMDHTPGQRQWHDIDTYRNFHRGRSAQSEAELDKLVEKRLTEQRAYAGKHRQALLERVQGMAVTLASHDDTTVGHVEEAVAAGITISEFPTTREAAAAAHAHAMTIVMGAPNVILGGSHSGNVSALDLAKSGHLDALSSDYVPVSLLHAVFRLVDRAGLTLPEAVAKVTRNPAAMGGFTDRGEIMPGKKGDLVQVRLVGDTPTVMAVWRGGRRIG